MKACPNWTDAIADCALGEAPKPDLAAHLAICQQCQIALRTSRAMAARIDEALHRSAAAEPPPYGPEHGPERVMARIRKQTNTRAWWRWAVAAGTALAASIVIAIVTWAHRPAPEADLTALSTWRSPTQALLRPPVAAVWATRPRLGQGYFKIKGEKHAQ